MIMAPDGHLVVVHEASFAEWLDTIRCASETICSMDTSASAMVMAMVQAKNASMHGDSAKTYKLLNYALENMSWP